jgi:hypothetical protein
MFVDQSVVSVESLAHKYVMKEIKVSKRYQ